MPVIAVSYGAVGGTNSTELFHALRAVGVVSGRRAEGRGAD